MPKVEIEGVGVLSFPVPPSQIAELIAQAERAHVASDGNCVSLAELQSSSALAMTRAERDGYFYSVECSGGDFNVVGRHAAAPAGSAIRYPNLGVDQNMQVHEVN